MYLKKVNYNNYNSDITIVYSNVNTGIIFNKNGPYKIIYINGESVVSHYNEFGLIHNINGPSIYKFVKKTDKYIIIYAIYCCNDTVINCSSFKDFKNKILLLNIS